MQQVEGVDPDDLAATLRVLSAMHHLPGDHPDHVTVKRAASHMYKSIKAERKLAARAAELAHDREIIERTATGSPMRIDDETAGIPLVSTTVGAFAGELAVARGCYICKQDFTLVDAFYHWLCPTCAAMSHAKRDQRTDLTGKRALLTGEGAGRGRDQRDARGLVVDAHGRAGRGELGDRPVVGELLGALEQLPLGLDRLVHVRRGPLDPHVVGVVSRQLVELLQHPEGGCQVLGVDAGLVSHRRMVRRPATHR